MTPQELKNSILQLAIQGRLVEQRPEEGTAAELYKQIQAEKQSLIKAGKLKKEKPLPPITDDEKPFDIPDSWMWVHLNQIAESSLGKTLDKAKNTGELCPYLCSINVYWNGISLEKVKEAKFTDDDKKKYKLEKGDLLICEGGDVGRTAIWELDQEMYYQNALHRVRLYAGLSPYYFKSVIECYKGIGIIDECSKGMTIKHLVQNSLYEIWLPLPPLAEQKRIVAKIEELLPLIDRYGAAWSRLEDFNKRFPNDMQKSILQMAIQGKLVEQRPEEGTAEDLYKQIQSEKQSLIKAGKLKKEKPLPPITDDEKPFDIPDTWKWVRLGNIISIESGKNLTSSQMIAGHIPVYGGNGITGYHNTSLVHEETIVIGRVGFYCGSIHITESEAWITDNAFITTYPKKSINREYLVHILRHMNLGKDNNATAQPVVSGKKIYPMLFPLPPLAEQKRIVAKIEELLPLCERLK